MQNKYKLKDSMFDRKIKQFLPCKFMAAGKEKFTILLQHQ